MSKRVAHINHCYAGKKLYFFGRGDGGGGLTEATDVLRSPE
jgi:hypothetical protein